MRRTAALLLTCMAVLPGGCVAAIAPIVAGGLMAKKQIDGPRSTDADVADSQQDAEILRTAGVEEDAPLIAAVDPAGELPALVPAQEPVPAPVVASAPLITEIPSDRSPRPALSAPTNGAANSAGQWATYAALHDFTVERARQMQALRQSALLVDPGTAQPNRKGCISLRSAIAIDLDPQGGFFALSGTASADPAMVSALSSLRDEGVSVYWITGLLADRVSQVKQRLAETGLDPEGKDTVLPSRYPGERKQGRRQTLGESHCLLAIAGDERADFDDLYDYLRDPGFAAPLESMIGNGWFLIPNPLS